ncbi:MAG: hypothetical protein F6K24_13390 [Okeania sp. SIO2D1]|nr:hypothetical protein [Okeania sp. SIO2D1]
MTLAKQNNNYPEPKKPTLIELAESVKDIVANFEEALENNDLEVAHEYEQRLQRNINNFGDKLEACYFAAKMLDKEGDAYKEEAQLMMQKASAKKNAASRIINMVKSVAMNIGGFKGERFKFTVCNNSTAPIWKQQDVEADNIPDEFVLTETVQHIDWKGIEKLAKESNDGCVRGKNGEVIAKVLPRGKHVRIR